MTTTRFINFFIFFIVLSAVGVGGYFAFMENQKAITSQTEEKHQAVTQGFAGSLWKTHKHKIMPLYGLSDDDLALNIDMAVFADDVVRYFQEMPLGYVQFVTPSGDILLSFSVGQTTMQGIANLDQALWQQARTNNTATTIASLGVTEPMLINGLYPVMNNDEQPELWLRLVTNSSQEQQHFLGVLAVAAGVVVLVFMNVILLGHFNIRHAEAIIARQYEDNAELAAAAESAKAENFQKSQFLANISHELRTPLNAVIGFSDILKNEYTPPTGQNNHMNYINDIHSAGTHLLSLINDILDYSKAEAGKLELEASEINAIKMVMNCLRLVQPRADTGQVRLEENLPKDQMTMITDGKKFKQILLNLLSNAVKFTPADGVVKVTAWIDMRDDMCVFEVKDSGIGISPKDISRAMSPFGQVDNALSRKYEGTGLGLPLTKKFVELMGGKFSIESEVNVGTKVTFSLPRELKPREGIIVKQVA